MTNWNKWDLRFLDLAELVGSWSKDPSTKVGAVITRGKRIISTGFNGFPVGVDDAPELYENREYKYEHIIHGEMNALLFAREDVIGTTLYTTPFMPCSRCAAMLIQAGIVRVVSYENHNPRWAGSFANTVKSFEKANPRVELVLYNKPTGERV